MSNYNPSLEYWIDEYEMKHGRQPRPNEIEKYINENDISAKDYLEQAGEDGQSN